jgi:hypothetical protein
MEEAMEFDDVLVEKLKADPEIATLHMLDELFATFGEGSGWEESDHAQMIQANALVTELISAGLLDFAEMPAPDISGAISDDCVAIHNFLGGVRTYCLEHATATKYQTLRDRFRRALTNVFAYEFSAGDVERVQQLIGELRDLLSAATQIEEGHRQRLLRRLEKLQSELHKKVSDLDRFWGLIGDAGVVAGKLGKDAKPFVDRVRELTSITWRTQARAEELPSGTKPPLLDYRPTEDTDVDGQ